MFDSDTSTQCGGNILSLALSGQAAKSLAQSTDLAT